jgi:hypothetical protein
MVNTMVFNSLSCQPQKDFCCGLDGWGTPPHTQQYAANDQCSSRDAFALFVLTVPH